MTIIEPSTRALTRTGGYLKNLSLSLFDPENPLATDPYLDEHTGSYAWLPSTLPLNHYCWVQPVSPDVQLDSKVGKIDLDNDTRLFIYKGPLKQKLLYRIVFAAPPVRFMIRPAHYCMFWSYGHKGGPSGKIKYLYRDRFLSVQRWTDKNSFLASLRQQHYLTGFTFWSR